MNFVRRLPLVVAVVCAAAVIPFACGPSEPSRSLKQSIERLQLQSARYGGFQRDDEARVFKFGSAKAPALESGQRNVKLLGASFEAKVDPDSGAMTVKALESSARFTLTPSKWPIQKTKGFVSDQRVFFMHGDDAVIHTPIDDGVKEDIVLTHPRGDTLSAEWELSLDDGLEAIVEEDGSVSIRSGPSRAPIYKLATPVILQAGGEKAPAFARYRLEGNRLILEASGLAALEYPIDLDPTIYVLSSATDFTLSSNLESGVEVDAAGQQVKKQQSSMVVDHVDGYANFPYQPAWYGDFSYGYSLSIYNGRAYLLGGRVSYLPSSTQPATNKVWTAVINADGTLGTWTQLSPMPSARSFHGAAAYNGFLYAVGGGHNSSFLSDVVYARINSDGSLGSWTTSTTTLPAGRSHFGFAVHEGFMYVVGGALSASTNAADTQVAQILPNGDVGPFSSTGGTNLPSARYGLKAAAYNGYLYAVGGTDGTIKSDVFVTPLSRTTGAISPWITSTNSDCAVRVDHGLIAHRGYLFSLYGRTASGDNYTGCAAQIGPGGLVGPFLNPGNTVASVFDHSGLGYAAYNGLIYVAGGAISNGGTVDMVNVVRPGASGGQPPPPSTTAYVGQGSSSSISCGGFTIHNGFAYQVGGITNNFPPYTYTSRISYTPLTFNPSGALLWTTTGSATDSLSQPRCTSSAAWNGYLYALSGETGPGTAVSTLNWWKLDASGAPSGLQSQSIGGANRSDSVLIAHDGMLYLVGGRDTTGAVLDDVIYLRLNPNDGSPLSENRVTGVLPTARANLSAAIFNGRLYVAGGVDGSGGLLSDAAYIPLNSDGSVSPGTYVYTTNNPSPRKSGTAVIVGSHFFELGGEPTGTSLVPDIQWAPISATGDLGAFQTLTSSRAQNYFNVSNFQAGAFNNQLIFGNGKNNSGNLTFARSESGQPFALTTAHNSATALSAGREKHCAVNAGGVVYVIGGSLSATPYLGDVGYKAPGATGNLTALTTSGNSLNTPRHSHACAAANGYLYVFGGVGSSGALSDLEYAQIQSNGDVGPWTAIPNALGAPLAEAAVAVSGTKVYLVGGWDGTAASGSILAGTLNGASTSISSSSYALPTVRRGSSAAVLGARLYVLGGRDGAGTTYLSDVISYNIGSNGSLTGGPTKLPALPFARANMAAVTTPGTVWLFGGEGRNGEQQLSVAFASVLGGNVLSQWMFAPSLPAVRDYAAATATRGFIYVIGGDQGGTPQSSVYYVGYGGGTPSSAYSRFIEFPSAVTSLDSITVDGTAPAGTTHALSWKTATAATGPWSALSTASIELGTPLSLGGSSPKYLWFEVRADDSAAQTVDNSQALSTITDITLTYTSPPPTALAFSTPAQTVSAVAPCSSAQVNAQDATGLVSGVTSPTTVTLTSSSGTTQFFTDSSCTTPGSAQTFAANASQQTFYFKEPTAGSFTLTATATSGMTLSSATQTVTVVAGPPTQLAFSSFGPSYVAGATIGGAGGFTVSARDARGNPVSDQRSISLTLAPPGSTLVNYFSCSTTNGVCTFSNLNIQVAGASYVITANSPATASSPALTVQSPTFAIVPDVADHLTWVTQPPATATSMTVLAPSPAVAIQDRFNNVRTGDTSAITLNLNNAGTAILSGTLTANAVNGVATFSDLKVDKAGNSYRLMAVGSVSTGTPSNFFNITVGAPAQLSVTNVFNHQASTTAWSSVFATVQDSGGNTVTSATNSITLSLNATNGATLGGTLTATASSGTATFSTLFMTKAGTGYTLTATSGTLTGTSVAFSVTPGTQTAIAYATDFPATVTGGQAISPTVRVVAKDAWGNDVVSGVAGSVTLTFVASPGLATLTPNSATLSSGVASFPTLSIDKAGSGYKVRATHGSFTVDSAVFDVIPGPLSTLTFNSMPFSVTAGATFAVQVRETDSAGNTITSANDSITLSIASGPAGGTLNGTLTVTAVNGVAGFSLNITKSGTYSLRAAAAALPNGTSASFNVNAANAATMSWATNAAASYVAGATAVTRVTILDTYGNPTTTPNIAITIGLNTNPGSDTLGGTLTQSTSFGPTLTFNTQLTKAATGYSFKVTAASTLSQINSTNFDVTPAAANKLVFDPVPATVTAGQTITPALSVRVTDTYGNTATGATNSVSLVLYKNPAGATVSGTLTQTAVAGVATFSGLSLNKSDANPFGFQATTTGLFNNGPVSSNDFNVVPGAAHHLSFQPSPTGALLAGQDLASNGGLKVEVRDALENVVTTATNPVTVTIGNNAGNGTLSGTATVAAVAGVASFTGLSINKAATGYTLSAAATNLLSGTSAPFSIGHGPLHHAGFTVEPVASTQAGLNLTPAVAVAALDLYDNVVKTANGTVSVGMGTNPTNATLTSGNGTVTLTNGLATFNLLSLTKAGIGYSLAATLTANATTYSATSASFNIAPGPKAKLQFKTQPQASVVSEALLTPNVEVQVNDTYDNLVASSSDVVTLSLATRPTGAVMGGTLSVAAVNGVAGFNDLTLDLIGNYTLRAAATGTSATLSSNVTVTAGAPYELAIIAPPPNSNAAGANIPLVVGAQDHAHNPVSNAGNTVTVALLSNPGSATLTGTLSGSLTGGSATLNPVITKAATGYTLRATSNPALIPVVTSPFDVTAGGADRLTFTQNPTDVVAGALISPAVKVALSDSFGNALTTGSNAISLAIGAGSPNTGATLFGTTTVNAVNGVATFSDLNLDKVGSGYRLAATGAAITNGGTSTTFNVTGGAAAGIFFPVTTGAVGAGACSGTPAVVSIKDASGNVTTTGTPVTITLSATGLQLFSDSGCNTTASTVTVGANQSSASFYFKANAAASYPVQATSSLGNATFTAVVSAGSAVKVAITTPARTAVTANSCSGAVSFQAADSADNVAPPATPTQVTLSGGSAVTFYADNICTQAVSSVTLNNQSPAATVYFKSTLAQTFTFTATSASLGAATQGEAVIAAPASRLVFSNNGPTVFAGTCSTARTLNVQDAYGNAQTAGSALTVLLSSSSGGTFFSDAACGTALTNSSLVITAPATSATLYYRHTVAGTPTVTAADASNTLTAASEQPLILAAAAHHLAFAVQPGASSAGQNLAGPPTVVVRDAFNNAVTTSSELVTVDFGNNTTGAMLTGTASQNATAGTAAFSALTVDKPGAYTLVATAPNSTSIQSATSSSFNVAAGPVAQLVFGVQPTDVLAGANISPAVTVKVTDALGNVVSSAGGQVSISLGQNPAGGSLLSSTFAPVSAVTLNVVQGIATFNALKVDKQSAGYTLIASRATLQDVESTAFTVAPGAATQLTFLQVPSTGKAFAALGLIEVGVTDRFSNLVETGAAVDVALDFAANPANATMTGGGIVTTSGGKAQFNAVTIDKKGTGYALLATSPGLTSATSSTLTIGAADATKLSFKSARQTAVATGQCSNTVQFETRDDGDNTAQLTSPATVTLKSTASTTKFYSDANCNNEVTTVSLPSGATGGSFYFKTQNGGPQTLTISATGLRSDQQIEDIVGDLPPTIAEQNASVIVGDTATFTVREGTGRAPFHWELVDGPSGASMDEFGHYTAGTIPTAESGKQDTIRVTDVNGATGEAFVTVDARPADQIPLTERPPLNGWSCGCNAGASGGAGLLPYLFAALLFGARRMRRNVLPRGKGPALVVAVMLLPSLARAAGAADLPMPPPPTLKSKKKDSKPAEKVEPPAEKVVEKPVEKPVEAPVEKPPALPRIRSVAVLAVEVTVPGEKLDGNAFSEMMTGAIDAPHLFHVISSKDVQTLLGIERQRQLTGCSENESCTAEIASALGADFVLESSVGKVGNNYLVSARLVDANKSKVVSRASLQAQSPNLLLNCVWRVAQEILDGYGGTLPATEAQRWKDRPREPPPEALVEEDTASSAIGITLLGVGGYQPASVPGQRASVGGEVTIGWRIKRLDVGVGGIIAPHPGARLSVSLAVLNSAGRLSLGVRGTAFPIDKVFGGGPVLTYELPLGSVFAVVGQAAADAYPGDGQMLVALLGGIGLSAHF